MTATKFSHFSYQADKTLGCRELFLPHLQTCTTVREGKVEPHSDLFCITDMCSRGELNLIGVFCHGNWLFSRQQ